VIGICPKVFQMHALLGMSIRVRRQLLPDVRQLDARQFRQHMSHAQSF
jgi:heme exporter protein D